ncbi:MAG: 6-carboxytetrahydropterin synthase [Methanomassiliicoccales archaeon]|nr:6-carboxytetrahydropterin synthase [Methanomassiliicoccales archaeon]
MTYTLSVSRSFKATHWMPGGKNEEKMPHQHDYRLQVAIDGVDLGDDGFLMDVDILRKELDDIIARFPDTKVNDLQELHGLPPSLENFAAAIWTAILARLNPDGLESMTVTLWESEDTSASFSQRLRR